MGDYYRPKRSELESRYGKIPAEQWFDQEKWMVTVPVIGALRDRLRYDGRPVGTIYCNKDMRGPLLDVFERILVLGLDRHIYEYNGCFSIRKSRASFKRSVHSWGLAIDINASTNQLGEQPTMHPEIVRVFKEIGFIWAGEFKRPDGMHFQWCTED